MDMGNQLRRAGDRNCGRFQKRQKAFFKGRTVKIDAERAENERPADPEELLARQFAALDLLPKRLVDAGEGIVVHGRLKRKTKFLKALAHDAHCAEIEIKQRIIDIQKNSFDHSTPDANDDRF